MRGLLCCIISIWHIVKAHTVFVAWSDAEMSAWRVGTVGVSVYATARPGFTRKGVSCCKIHFRWIKAVKGKNKAIKPLDEKRGEYFHDLGGGKAILSKTRNPEAIKEKPDRFYYIKIKSLCMANTR